MERGGEEAKTEESTRSGARPLGRIGAQRGQTVRQPRKRSQGRSDQKPQENNRRSAQRPTSASWPPQAVIEIVIASICSRFGAGIIGQGSRGIRFTATGGASVLHARTIKLFS